MRKSRVRVYKTEAGAQNAATKVRNSQWSIVGDVLVFPYPARGMGYAVSVCGADCRNLYLRENGTFSHSIITDLFHL
jgi:hypothetical protein